MTKQTNEDSRLNCSFCAKPHNKVKKLIAGPHVYICDECIGFCNEILAEELHEAKDVSMNSSLERLLSASEQLVSVIRKLDKKKDNSSEGD